VDGEDSNGYRVITLGVPYAEVTGALSAIRKKTGVGLKGFSEMTVEEVSALTGLDAREAGLARRRDFDEPFVFTKGEGGMEAVIGEIERMGYRWTRGRIHHILGRHDKGRAVRILKGYYASLYGEISVVAAGDGLNDLPLLEEADFPILVKKSDGSHEPMEIDGLVRTDGIGPSGWNSALMGLLKKLA